MVDKSVVKDVLVVEGRGRLQVLSSHPNSQQGVYLAGLAYHFRRLCYTEHPSPRWSVPRSIVCLAVSLCQEQWKRASMTLLLRAGDHGRGDDESTGKSIHSNLKKHRHMH